MFKSCRLLIIVIGLVGLIFQLCAVANGMELTKVNFSYNGWGSYYTTSYGSEMYFAGYVGGGVVSSNIFTFNTTSNSGQLHRILMNDNNIRVLNIGDSLPLGDGYQFQLKDIDVRGGVGLFFLFQNGNKVESTPIVEGQTYVYAPAKVGNVSNLPIIEVHISNISSVSKTVAIDGVFEISETFITVTSPSDIPMKITSWSNNQTNDKQFQITVPLDAIRRFNITYNNIAQVFAHGTNGTLIGSLCPDIKNCYQDVRFEKGAGSYYVSNSVTNLTLGSDSKTWYVTVLPMTDTLTSTPTLTPTLTSTPTITITPTPTPTSTIQIPDVKKRAQLQVTYDTSLANNERITIRVILKNIGNATASNINLTIDHAPELEPLALSGSDKIGNTITWKGELKPNEEHISEYSIKGIKGKYLEIPLKATYFKISPEEKAKALGVSSAPLTPDEQEIIILIIRAILPNLNPGFEAIVAIMLLIIVYQLTF